MVGRPTSRVSRVWVSGPLAGFVEAYEEELRERGYTPRSAVGKLRQVGRLSCWLEGNGLSAGELNRDRVEEFLAFQRSTGRSRSQWSRQGLVCLLDVLRVEGVLAAEQPAAACCPAETLLGSFERHLLAERGLAAGTARGYVRQARRFLEGLPAGRDLAEVTAADVIGAVLRDRPCSPQLFARS